ncbi:RNA polymerase sigma factor [Variovorax ginsengisoli]|uniref:RNA polymerase sigma-70 factor (ECF subfamily) n=1 Tax=Variovorax ginsengisoli TaxID=363844 RepID=A0ABT9S602_9BURK|nr:sigma-70 family RNA polymerase sigma factor [Variovorax ginsengisoli]MDP9899789.1 RNA polymerase sigma-70 factor (ECF subfamily) [Variovorax ginsengisoli]
MFERYYRELLNFLARSVRDRETAAELAQESFARVYAAQREGTTVRDARALLYKIARNLVTDGHRRAQAHGQPAPCDISDDSASFDAQAGSESLEPDVALASRQRFEAIASVVDTLPPRCREAFMLVKFDGLTHAETAARMGIAVKTVEMQVQIALELCWTRLEAFDGIATGAHPSRTPRRRSGQ